MATRAAPAHRALENSVQDGKDTKQGLPAGDGTRRRWATALEPRSRGSGSSSSTTNLDPCQCDRAETPVKTRIHA